MICSEDKLDSAINTGCSTPFGMEHNGYLTLRDGLVGKSVTNLVATFTPSESVIPVYQPIQDISFKPKSEGEKNAYGLTKYAKSIEVFLVANTELTQNQIMQLKDKEWIFVGKQIDGSNLVFGYERGLRLKTTSQELSSTDTHGGILLTFDETFVNYPMLFSSDNVYDWINYEVITDLTIGSGLVTPQKVYLEVDASKTCYVVLPSGAVLTSTAGIVDDHWDGVAGAITLIVPNTTTKVNTVKVGVYNSSFIGVFTCDLACSFYINSLITSASLINATSISCDSGVMDTFYAPLATTASISCSLTAKAIGDFLISANRFNAGADGTAYFLGGTNADETQVDTYLITQGKTLAEYLILLSTWTITLNPTA